MVFAIGTSFRKGDERTFEGVSHGVGTLVDMFAADECMRCLSHAGCGPT